MATSDNTLTEREAGQQEAPKRFGVRDLRNDTAAVLDEAQRSGAVYITRHGEVVAKLIPHRDAPDPRTPMQQLLDRVAGLPRTDTSWAEEHATLKLGESEAHGGDPWE